MLSAPTCNCLDETESRDCVAASHSLGVNDGKDTADKSDVVLTNATTGAGSAAGLSGADDGPGTGDSQRVTEADVLTAGELPPSSDELEIVQTSQGGRRCAP